MDIYQDPDPMPLAVNLDSEGVDKIMNEYGATLAERNKLFRNGSVYIGGVKVWIDRGGDDK